MYIVLGGRLWYNCMMPKTCSNLPSSPYVESGLLEKPWKFHSSLIFDGINKWVETRSPLKLKKYGHPLLWDFLRQLQCFLFDYSWPSWSAVHLNYSIVSVPLYCVTWHPPGLSWGYVEFLITGNRLPDQPDTQQCFLNILTPLDNKVKQT